MKSGCRSGAQKRWPEEAVGPENWRIMGGGPIVAANYRRPEKAPVGPG